MCSIAQDEVVHRLPLEGDESAEAMSSAADRVVLVFDPRASAASSAGLFCVIMKIVAS